MKSLINLDDDSNVTDISPVLTCIRSLSDSEAIWDKDKKGLVTSLSLKQLKNETDTLREDGFIFVVSLRDGSCLYTSKAISLYLGYPKDMWIGQCVMNFIYHKDHITFANYLTQGLNACFMQVKREDAHLFVNTFFCRLRLYQGLKFGYSVKDQKQQYKPFKITFHLNEMLLDDICVEKSAATLCVKATATQVTAGYTTPEEIPAMTSFSTRHTASCHFSHVDVRFFASQPKTYSDESEEYNRNEKCSSGEGYQASSSGSGNASGKESGGNASKEPSNSSKSEKKNQESASNSSKCNISSACDSGYGKSLEKKDRDNHNNSNEGSSNEGWKTSANETANKTDKFSSCAALTEESLVTHNRISNKHLKHHQRKNKNSLGIPTKDNWFYQKDPHHHKHKKGPHNVVSTPTQTDATNVISAPGSVTPISEHTSSTQLTSQSCMANNYVGSTHTPTPFFIPVVYMGSVPCYPPMSSMHLQTSLPFWSCASGGETNSKDAALSATISTEPVNFANSIKNANKLSACLTPNQAQFAGMPFSILQPSEVSLQANTTDQFKSCMASDVKISENQEGEDAENKFSDKTEPNECDMLVDESRSSYFTQSSSFQSVDKEEEMEFETKKTAPHPSRSEKEELDSEIAFRYRMEVHQMEDILKKDLEALKSMQQPDPVNKQLQMLQDELKEMSEDKNMQKGDFFMSESSLLGLITEDDVNEELDHREDYLLQLMCEDS
ncbi:period circadian protein-like [Uloborus diversus]|uniref:period circadian protein-like n=1 Tax=Uloborus diversus TaxID=327109 RepID=UPI0024098A6E|nr:period circadian protein-like [Uloborus diversus]